MPLMCLSSLQEQSMNRHSPRGNRVEEQDCPVLTLPHLTFIVAAPASLDTIWSKRYSFDKISIAENEPKYNGKLHLFVRAIILCSYSEKEKIL